MTVFGVREGGGNLGSGDWCIRCLLVFWVMSSFVGLCWTVPTALPSVLFVDFGAVFGVPGLSQCFSASEHDVFVSSSSYPNSRKSWSFVRNWASF